VRTQRSHALPDIRIGSELARPPRMSLKNLAACISACLLERS
jgi:hypothetical protein